MSQHVISFARGSPSPDLVPAPELRQCMQKVMDDEQVIAALAAYANSAGFPALREWLAERHGVSADQVLVTNGSMQAAAFLFEHLVSPGTPVAIEAPTYDRTLKYLQVLGAELLPLPLERDGVDVAALASATAAGQDIAFAHIIPNFHNPAGYTLSEAKRRQLVDLAQERDFLIFEDDPYVEVAFSGNVPPRMQDLDRRGQVVYASSFSKIVTPGIRVGYLVAPPELIAPLTELATRHYIMPNQLSQALVYEFCTSGLLEPAIERVRSQLKRRSDTLAKALSEHLPDARFDQPGGGYFLWAELPEGVDIEQLARAAADEGVAFVAGNNFFADSGSAGLRLAYSGVTLDEIDEGVRRLARAYGSL